MRGFGSQVKLGVVKELGGGTLNEAYLINLGGDKVVLRVAPPPSTEVYWDDVALMRREYSIAPYFASIASLIPRILLADFTHQVLQRDYLFQSFLEGERWSDVEDELSMEESRLLWRQCGKIVKQIHTTIR